MKSQKKTIDVCIDIGGSGTKISVREQGSDFITPPVRFSNLHLFQKKTSAGRRIARAIFSVVQHYQSSSSIISTVAISMTGQIDHKENMLILSHRLQDCELTGDPYGRFDLAGAIMEGYKNLYKKDIKVFLLNDSISSCLDPIITQKLVLTLTMGTFPVISLSEKGQKSVKIYRNYVANWVNQITLQGGWDLTTVLFNDEMNKRDQLKNCQLIVEAVVKILNKYKQVFKWQPQCMLLLGGFANQLKHLKNWPKQIANVKMIVIKDHDESIKTQMRGALSYAKNRQKFNFL